MNEITPTVMVLDDDQSVLEALDSLLRAVGFQVKLYSSVNTFLADSLPNNPSCLILDVRMPSKNGFDVQSELSRRGIDLPIVFISGHGDIPMSVRAIRAGAVHFLSKPFREQDLLEATQEAIDKDRCRRGNKAASHELAQKYATLTPREREIMAHVVTGALNRVIATELAVSEITVKVHRAQVMRKMSAETLADLVRMDVRLNTGSFGI